MYSWPPIKFWNILYYFLESSLPNYLFNAMAYNYDLG